jgi:carbon-monoxide dehydrogenase large subunit
VYFDPPGPTFPGAVHVAVVELDRETGGVRVLKYVVVEDCGPVLNPRIVEGAADVSHGRRASAGAGRGHARP